MKNPQVKSSLAYFVDWWPKAGVGELPIPLKLGSYPWRLFFVLVSIGLLIGPLRIPYSLELIAMSHGVSTPPPQIRWSLVVSSVWWQATHLIIPTALGLAVAQSLGLRAPYLEAWLYQKSRPSFQVILMPVVVWASVACFVAFAIDGLFSLKEV